MGMVLWSVESVPIEVTWMNPMRKSLSKWMDSLRNEWIEWIERFEMKWVNWRSDLEQPYGSDLSEPNGKVPMIWEWMSLSIWLDWSQWESPMFSWMNVPMRVTWNNPMGKSLWSIESVPIKVTGMNPMRKSLSKWSESMRNEWIEVNRVNRGEMSDLKDLTWNPFKVTWVNSVGISLWVENECPYQSDLRWVIWPNPIKMNGIDEKWMNWGE